MLPHEAVLASLPPVKTDHYSTSLPTRDAEWFFDRVGEKISNDWYLSAVQAYEIDGYKMHKLEFESVEEVEGGRIDLGMDRAADGSPYRVLLLPEEIPAYVAELRKCIGILTQQILDMR